MKPKILLPFIATLPFMLTGCIVAAIGAGVGAVKYGNASKKNVYASYRTAADKNNTEREEHGLKPVHILTFDEWNKGVEGTNAPAK